MRALSDSSANVGVVDRKAGAFSNLGRSFVGAVVQDIGYNEDALAKAGIVDCDVVAAVTQSDNANPMATEVASRLYGVP